MKAYYWACIVLLSIALSGMAATYPSVRPYTQEDLDAIIEFVVANDTDNFYMPVANNIDEKRNYLRTVLTEHSEGNFILESPEGIVIGFFNTIQWPIPSQEFLAHLRTKGPEYRRLIARLESRDLPEKSDGFYLYFSIIIAQDYRRQGLARFLIQQSLAQSQEPDDMPIEITLLESNRASQALFRSLGFSERYRYEDTITFTSAVGAIKTHV